MKFYALVAECLNAITRENKPIKRQGSKTAKLNKIKAMIQHDGIFLSASAGPRKIQLVGSIGGSKATVLTSRKRKRSTD